jgi:hypothetical protein
MVLVDKWGLCRLDLFELADSPPPSTRLVPGQAALRRRQEREEATMGEKGRGRPLSDLKLVPALHLAWGEVHPPAWGRGRGPRGSLPSC